MRLLRDTLSPKGRRPLTGHFVHELGGHVARAEGDGALHAVVLLFGWPSALGTEVPDATSW